MDLDDATRQIQEAPDVPGVSDVLIDLIALVGRIDRALAQERQHRQDLERAVKRLRERLEFAGKDLE